MQALHRYVQRTSRESRQSGAQLCFDVFSRREAIASTTPWKMPREFSAIEFRVSITGLISQISQQQTRGSLTRVSLKMRASSTKRPPVTGVPVPIEIAESILSTSKLT